MPHLANPALMLQIEKACSKGTFTIRANSLLLTTKFFFVRDKEWTALAKCALKDLKTDTSIVAAVRGWYVVANKTGLYHLLGTGQSHEY